MDRRSLRSCGLLSDVVPRLTVGADALPRSIGGVVVAVVCVGRSIFCKWETLRRYFAPDALFSIVTSPPLLSTTLNGSQNLMKAYSLSSFASQVHRHPLRCHSLSHDDGRPHIASLSPFAPCPCPPLPHQLPSVGEYLATYREFSVQKAFLQVFSVLLNVW